MCAKIYIYIYIYIYTHTRICANISLNININKTNIYSECLDPGAGDEHVRGRHRGAPDRHAAHAQDSLIMMITMIITMIMTDPTLVMILNIC